MGRLVGDERDQERGQDGGNEGGEDGLKLGDISEEEEKRLSYGSKRGKRLRMIPRLWL